MHRFVSITLTLTLILIAISVAAEAQNYEPQRAAHKTRLITFEPSPQPFDEEVPPKGVQLIEYPSGAAKLRGWLALPSTISTPVPAIVFLHGGFAFSVDDYRQTKPFLDAGYAVMFPFLRGENGNPGNFELFYGEVEDALAATRWLSKHRQIRADRIAIFGHSVGGALAELTSLWTESTITLSGSIGSLYPPEIFEAWKDFAPFDTTDRKEIALRTFVINFRSMKRRHMAYLGNEEPGVELVEAYRALAAKYSAPLSISIVPGNHETSVAPAMKSFLKELSKLAK